MFRDLGSIKYNRTPVNGYQSPRFKSERGNVPIPERTSPMDQWRRRRLAAAAFTISNREEQVVQSSEPESLHTFGNETLPVYEYWDEISDAINTNRVVLVVGETGSGKSTQVPQIAYEAGFSVTITQPRRLPATRLDERLRDEMTTVQSDLPADIVGYHTAEKNTTTPNTRIKVVTDGLRLVQDMNSQGEVENEVLIIDEVHEWNVNIEVLIAWTKKLLKENSNLRVVVMSATMDAHRLAEYFAEVCDGVSPPIIEVPGRTFGVEEIEQPRSTIIEQTVKYAMDGKNILVFVPGKREIYETIEELRRQLPKNIADTATILPLHSKMSQQAQDRAFQSYGGVKIIVATNVAQTSLTIDDIDVVIDSGLERRTEIDEEGVESLVLHPISQADSKQRAGRAGRVREGIYVLTRLDTDTPYIPFIARQTYPTPEILRSDVDRNVLQVAAAGLDFSDLELFHPVDIRVIDRAKHALRVLGALDDDNKITALGCKMNAYPVGPALARMLVEAQQYSPQTRAYMSAIAASMEMGGLPNFGYNIGKRWKKLTEEKSSDLLMQLDVFIAAQTMKPFDMLEFDLDIKNVTRAQEHHDKIAKRSNAQVGILPPPSPQQREHLKQCIYTGMIDYAYEYIGSSTYSRLSGDNEQPREISNRSVVIGRPKLVFGSPWRVEYMKDGAPRVKHIVEQVTTVESAAVLGQIAINMCCWVPEGDLVWRQGRLMEVQKLRLYGHATGDSREVEAVPSPELRDRIIAHVIENPGPAQRQLRVIKKTLEDLQHLTRTKVPQLTQDMLLAWINEAAPDDVTDPSVIDKNLNKKIYREGINLDYFIPAEERQDILNNAPETITAYGVTLHLRYRGGWAVVHDYDPVVVAAFPEDVFLPNGSLVRFRVGRKNVGIGYFHNELTEKMLSIK